MAAREEDEIQYFGEPAMTASGKDVVGFHLQRYVAGWLQRYGRDRILITVGFSGSMCASATFTVVAGGSSIVEVGWTFDDLRHMHQYGDSRLHIEQRGAGEVVYSVTPVRDLPGYGKSSPQLLGFALLMEVETLAPEAVMELQVQIAEAIRAARRNAIRLFFDDHKTQPVKASLYKLLSHLPEWTGCDHSASLIMTANLEAMTLEGVDDARFAVLAERVFFSDVDRDFERLVGMSLELRAPSGAILRTAVERQHLEPDAPYQVFVRPDGQEGWIRPEDPEQVYERLHCCKSRPRERMYVLVPLIAQEGMETELLGFICLAFCAPLELPISVSQMLVDLSTNLATRLRFSPLYTLSARKFWILNQTRAALERALDGVDEAPARVEALIGEISALLARHVEVPSLAIAYLRPADYVDGKDDNGMKRRSLRYVHPYGWTHFDQLNLDVDVSASERVDSGVSSLAVRLGRALVLAGGHGEGEAQSFKNYLYVHEETKTVADARSPETTGLEDEQGWVRLSDYYKPARATAYATLAYPILFQDRVLGMLTIEVDKNTNWLWWTGFGGQLFWELLASELAYSFHALGVSS